MHVIGALLLYTIILVLYGSHMVLQGRSLVVLYGAPLAYLLVVHVIGALLSSYFHVVSYLYFMSAIWYCKAVLWLLSFCTAGAPYYGRVPMLFVDRTNFSINSTCVQRFLT